MLAASSSLLAVQLADRTLHHPLHSNRRPGHLRNLRHYRIWRRMSMNEYRKRFRRSIHWNREMVTVSAILSDQRSVIDIPPNMDPLSATNCIRRPLRTLPPHRSTGSMTTFGVNYRYNILGLDSVVLVLAAS